MKSTIHFCKMHGIGNDFIVLNGITQSIVLDQLPIKQLANRHVGIGFDQLLLVEKSLIADVACRIFNADGSEAEQCGNGMRCVARFIQEENLTEKDSITIETKAGVISVTIKDYDTIEVIMGNPCFQPEKIPLKLSTTEVNVAVVSMGNPHAILQVPDVKNFPVEEIGKELAVHPAFPAGVNVGFMEIIDRQHIKLRTFERGAGETLACGSNACAAAAAGIYNQWLDHSVDVSLPGGGLKIEWQDENQPLKMTGPAMMVFSGEVSFL